VVGDDVQRGDGGGGGEEEKSRVGGELARVASFGIVLWASWVVAFLLINYNGATSPWPSALTALDVRTWALVHAVSGSLFAGGIFTTTFLEWLVFRSPSRAVQEFWFSSATKAEAALVLPGLTGLLVSGVAQAWLTYQCPIKYAPLYVKLPIHVLALFGLWWLLTDLTTRDAVNDKGKQLRRQGSNLVSCMLLISIYAIMVLKPGG
jgi:hypothetical protein